MLLYHIGGNVLEKSIPAHPTASGGLTPYLSPLGVWALSFGCAVGWGAFVMPGSTFLPIGGPLGVAIGMTAGALVMLLIGLNYHYMMNHCSDAGGTYAYVKKIFGYDHGFMSAWFLMLVYIAIIWANATALPLIFRNLLGNKFQVGFHYQLAGFDVYLGEVILSISVMWLLGLLCAHSKRLAVRVQTGMAVLLFGGVLTGFGAAVAKYGGGVLDILPSFAPGHSPLAAVIGVAVLAPWAFAGFESISQSAEEFRFSPKQVFRILMAAVVTGAMAYIFLAIMAVSVLPYGYHTWPAYLDNLKNMPGLAGIPTFHAADMIMGSSGLILLGFTVLAAVGTGLVGNYIAVSRLIYAMTRDDLLPEWFGRVNGEGIPRNAIFFILLLSLPIPFLGRSAISWIIDVNTIGATIAYAYTSAVAFWSARKEGNVGMQVSGLTGTVISTLFFLYFMVPGISSLNTMSSESYLILIGWSVLGFVFFRYIFYRDTEYRFGKSTVVWIALLFLIFFTSMLWLRQTTQETSRETLNNLSNYYVAEMKDHGITLNPGEKINAGYFLQQQMEHVNMSLTGHNLLQMVLIAITLLIMFGIYNSMMQREKMMEVEKVAAERSSKAKSTFFFNMSHDIRTPMNAIVGYTALLKKEQDLPPTAVEYLSKIEASSAHLLELINDILEMSRIENGKLELNVVETDLVKTMDEMRDLFITQMETKGISYEVHAEDVAHSIVLCDTKLLNRILLNLISNAWKFTPKGGQVSVTLSEQEAKEDGIGSYELRVKDTGIGMMPEFAAKVFDAYERDRTVHNIQGTGLGMTITKSIVDSMKGTIAVKTKQGMGTEFIIRLQFPILSDSAKSDSAKSDVDFKNIKLLLVEDLEVNREIATLILSEFGFRIDTAENGKIAVEKVNASKGDAYQLVLMDVQMPVMNGYEAARAIRALPDPELSSVPIIAMTANAFSEDVQNAKDAGMNAHIAKPLDVPKMMKTLTEVLSQSSAADAKKNNRTN